MASEFENILNGQPQMDDLTFILAGHRGVQSG